MAVKSFLLIGVVVLTVGLVFVSVLMFGQQQNDPNSAKHEAEIQGKASTQNTVLGERGEPSSSSITQNSEKVVDEEASSDSVEGLVYNPNKPLAYNNHPYMVHKDSSDPRVQSVVKAIQSGSFPERIDHKVQPKPFDVDAFRKNPQAYIDIVEPGRAFQVTFDPKAPKLNAIGKSWHQIQVGKTMSIAVQATPGAPVSWLSPAGGIFTESRLNAMTTIADAKGVARVTWYATPGTINQAVVVVGSPLLQHQVHFNFNVVEPAVLAANEQ